MKYEIYYAVSGANAFGVYTNKNWIENVMQYIQKPEIIKCTTLSQAFCVARDNYNAYQEEYGVDAAFYGSSLDIKLNRVIFKRDIIKMNQLE